MEQVLHVMAGLPESNKDSPSTEPMTMPSYEPPVHGAVDIYSYSFDKNP